MARPGAHTTLIDANYQELGNNFNPNRETGVAAA